MTFPRRLAAALAASTLALVPAACGDEDRPREQPSGNPGVQDSQGGGSETKQADPGPEAEPTGTQPGLTQETQP